MIEDKNKTRLTLIQKIKDTDNSSGWEDFVSVYKTMIINWATYMGCTHSMADDVFQESIISLLRNLPDFEYSPSKGRFRGYLKTLVYRRVKDAFRRKKLVYENEFDIDGQNHRDYIENISDTNEPEEAQIDLMWTSSIVSHALKNAISKVDSQTYESFDLYAVQELPINEVCRQLGIDKEGTVYQQKSRFLKLVSKELHDLLHVWGDIALVETKLHLHQPQLLKCITQMVKEISSEEKTMIFDPEKVDNDSQISFACKQIVAHKIPNSSQGTPSILNTAVVPRQWISLETDKCTIGRLASATISMEGDGISTLHSVILKRDSEWYLKDENSTNGTYLNGEKMLSETLLKSGDVIHISEKALIFTTD